MCASKTQDGRQFSKMQVLKIFAKILIIAIIFMIIFSQRPTETMLVWLKFKVKYSKKYKNVIEEMVRFKIFIENVNEINRHNDLNVVSFTMEVNEFADLLEEELHNYENNGMKVNRSMNFTPVTVPNIMLPSYVNWTEQGAVTNIKNQGFCGSCWAFAATGALEGQQFLKTKELTSLSEQNLIDCSGEYGNNGCQGGYPPYAYEYVQFNHGIDTEKDYPYDEEDFLRCRYKAQYRGATAKGYVSLPPNDESKLMEAVAIKGPISAGIDASKKTFRFYKEGIYYEPDCCPENDMNHAVLIVGYGTDDDTGMQYWIVKNSWGKNWGEKGYIKMVRNRGNNCCIASDASYPLV